MRNVLLALLGIAMIGVVFMYLFKRGVETVVPTPEFVPVPVIVTTPTGDESVTTVTDLIEGREAGQTIRQKIGETEVTVYTVEESPYATKEGKEIYTIPSFQMLY